MVIVSGYNVAAGIQGIVSTCTDIYNVLVTDNLVNLYGIYNKQMLFKYHIIIYTHHSSVALPL